MDVADEIERKEGRPLPAPGGDGRAGRVAHFDVDGRGRMGDGTSVPEMGPAVRSESRESRNNRVNRFLHERRRK